MIDIGSNTAALRAQRVLSRYGVRSNVARRTSKGGGCVFGIEIESYDYETAVFALRKNGISSVI